MARDRFAALARMNFSSPYVVAAAAADGCREPAGLRPPVQRRRAWSSASPNCRAELDLGELLDRPAGQAVGGPEDPRRAGQGADQPAGAAAAGRADRQPRSRYRRLGAHLAGALPRRERLHDPARLAQHGRGGAAVLPRADAEAGPHRRSRQPAGAAGRATAARTWRRCSSTSPATAAAVRVSAGMTQRRPPAASGA